MIYLDHAATSFPKAPGVREAMGEALDADPATWDARFAQAHEAVARFAGVSTDALLLTPGCTSALALAVGQVGLGPGDRVVISGMEHRALEAPVRASGAEVVVVPRAVDGPLDLDAYDAIVARGAGLVAVNAASNVTGEGLPVDAIVDRARRAGVPTLLDLAQVVGWHTRPFPDWGADMVAAGGHKGLQGPWGIGLLWSRGPMPGWCEGGSTDRAALHGLVAAIRHGYGPAPMALLDRLEQGLAGLGLARVGATPVVPSISVVPPGSAAAFSTALRANGLRVSGGRQCAPLAHRSLGTHETGTVRFSLGPATTDVEVDAAIAVVARVLAGA
jgi:selenocysteine lyase/cysteine desulfurase